MTLGIACLALAEFSFAFVKGLKVFVISKNLGNSYFTTLIA